MRFPLPVLLSPLREARKLCGTRAKSGSRAQARVFAEVHWVGEADGLRRSQCWTIMSIGASLSLSCPGCVEQDGRPSGRTLGQHVTDLTRFVVVNSITLIGNSLESTRKIICVQAVS